jgi:hypothetical protein
MRGLVVLVALTLSACATSGPAVQFDRSDMMGFKADCGQARSQVDYLQARIDAYHAYFKSNPITLEDRRYYTRLKNNIWSLRASCSALQR